MFKLFNCFVCFLFITFSAIAQTETNKLDEKGQRHGVWHGLYPESKSLRYEGTFDHGKETGTFKFYEDSPEHGVVATREFATDGSAYTIFYDQKNNKLSEGKEVNRKYEGPWKYYQKASTEIFTLENYKNGKLEGKRTVYYIGGKPAEEIIYKNGIKDGPYRKYTESGIVLEESNYKKGEYDGKAIFRDALGKIASEGNYNNGKKRGIWKFYKDGKLDREENMSKAKTNKLAELRAKKAAESKAASGAK